MSRRLDGARSSSVFDDQTRFALESSQSCGATRLTLASPSRSRTDASPAILIDILTEIVIDRPRAEVAAYAADPARAPDWYLNICDVEWQTEPRLEVGTRVAFLTRMVGRMHSHTYEVVEYVPEERLTMLNREGAFPVETTYTWEERDERSTRMTMRYRGEPTGLLKLLSSFMGAATRRAIEKDLERLKRLIETLAPASNEPA